MITGHTRVFALLGDPVAHSLSPAMHNAGFRAAGLDAVYVPMLCAKEDLASVMRTLARQGGGGNVTVPHKQAAAAVGTGDTLVQQLGVANVFSAPDGELRVSNTDVQGLLALLDKIGAPAGSWCVVGTGGSARAVVGAAARRGARLAVMSRDGARASSFRAMASALGVEPATIDECQVLINATPLGLHHEDALPVELAALPVVAWVADLTYRSGGTTALVELAYERGLAAGDGREMLLAQGVAAWSHWFPDVNVPVEVMRAAIEEHLD